MSDSIGDILRDLKGRIDIAISTATDPDERKQIADYLIAEIETDLLFHLITDEVEDEHETPE